MERVLVISRVGQHGLFSFAPTNRVFAESIVVLAFSNYGALTIVQGRCHEYWARFFASSMKDDMRYGPSDCFETFPFPPCALTPSPSPSGRGETLEAAGRAYYDFRADLMVRNNQGLTKTYNRFHDPDETSPDIARLRDLHAALDRAVLDAYGWTDIPTHCKFLSGVGRCPRRRR